MCALLTLHLQYRGRERGGEMGCSTHSGLSIFEILACEAFLTATKSTHAQNVLHICSEFIQNDSIIAGYVENAPTLTQPGSALVRYVAKMAAVEYEKCTAI
ncbi:unnamed protein product [Boreogadus saida]